MPRTMTGPAGTRLHLPATSRGKAKGATIEVVDNPLFINTRLEYYFFEDFDWDVFDINEHPLAYFDSSPVGDPTAVSGLVADGPFGEFLIKLAADSEAETFGFTMGDNRFIPANALWLFEARLKVSAITTNQVVVIGMGHDANATLDSVTLNAWFRLDGSLALKTELDDNTTDVDDYVGDDAQTLTADTYYFFTIENGFDGFCHFRITNANGEYEREFAKIKSSGFATTTLQPHIIVQKASGTTQPTITVDSIKIIASRL